MKCDATAIKTAGRSQEKPTFYLLKNATILKSGATPIMTLPFLR